MVPPRLVYMTRRLAILAVLCCGAQLACAEKVTSTVDAMPSDVRSLKYNQACMGLKIGILYLEDFAEPGKECSVDDYVVDVANGVIYDKALLGDEKPWANVPHHHGSHSQAWFLEQAIRNSGHFQEDLDKADIIFVNDYCYYTKWLAHVHTVGMDFEDTPGDLLLELYGHMLASPRWQRKRGADYVFFDGHSGFQSGKAIGPYDAMVCHDFRNSIHLVTDKSMRNVCPREDGVMWPWEKLLVVPYVPGRMIIDQPMAHMKEPSRPLSRRDLLTFFIATCIDPQEKADRHNAGKAMRGYFAQTFVNETDMKIYCVNNEYTPEMGGKGMMNFQEMYHHMTRSIFCLVFPGDSSSTRRFSEIWMSGCIPVLLGPPYHSLPFVDDVDYLEAVIMLNITDHSPWMPALMEWSFTGESDHETDAKYWFPDKVAKEVVTLPNAEAIPEYLRNFPVEAKLKKLELMKEYRSLMSYDIRMTDPINALNVEIGGVCKRYRESIRGNFASVIHRGSV